MVSNPPTPSLQGALSFASDLIKIPSLSGNERDVAKRLWEEMQFLGFEQMRVDEVGNVMGVIPGEGHAPPVMFNCHFSKYISLFALDVTDKLS